MPYDNKTILITGGTGSFGTAFVPYVLSNYKPKKVIIYSRDEMKQWHLQKKFSEYENLRFFLGDVRDLQRLQRAMKDVDLVIHAAATKIVPTAEYNPFECIKTNIDGARNVVDAAIDQNVDRVVALSTDKASSPINLYGATKLVSDKCFVAGNAYVGSGCTKFSVVRYGNVMGSRGSVIPFFLSLPETSNLPITDIRMTRFMLTLREGIDLVTDAFTEMVGGEIFVKKIPSMHVVDIAKACRPSAEIEVIGIRPGEKVHEQMISLEDAPYTYEYENYYKILPLINEWFKDPKRIGSGVKVADEFTYSSDNNTSWMSRETLNKWISIYKETMGDAS